MENNKEHNRYETGEWSSDRVVGWAATVYVGGNYQTSEMVCRKACYPKGLCITIEPTKYIFAGGSEDGVRVGFVQYPPFPEEENKLLERAVTLGRDIAEAGHQWSYLVVTPKENLFFSRRKK